MKLGFQASLKYLLIQHVWVLGEPHTQKLESCYYHGVEVSRLKRRWTAALVHNVPTYGADSTFAISRVDSDFYLVFAYTQHKTEKLYIKYIITRVYFRVEQEGGPYVT